MGLGLAKNHLDLRRNSGSLTCRISFAGIVVEDMATVPPNRPRTGGDHSLLPLVRLPSPDRG